MLMCFKNVNLRLVERKWYWIVAGDFPGKANLKILLSGIGVKVHFALEGRFFDNSYTFFKNESSTNIWQKY